MPDDVPGEEEELLRALASEIQIAAFYLESLYYKTFSRDCDCHSQSERSSRLAVDEDLELQ